MKVIDSNMLPKGTDTKTLQDLGMIIGMKPHVSKQVVSLYPRLTVQRLTEQLGAVYNKKASNLQEIDSFSFEWKINVNRIAKIKFAVDCNEDGSNGSIFPIILENPYYAKNETFELENEQQLFVKKPGEKIAEGKYRYWVQLVTNKLDGRVNTSYMTRGKETKYVSNYHPELSERGYNKFMHNFEKHMNYISRHRAGDSFSGDYQKLKQKYIEHGGDYFKMSSMDKQLLDYLYMSFENSMLLGHGNFTDKHEILIQEEDGRPIPMGQGIIQQIRNFCDQIRYTSLTRRHLDNMISSVVERLENKTGNKIAIACNWRMYKQVQELLDNLLKDRVLDNYFYDVNGGKIKVGAHYAAYEFAGNVLTFMENDALTERYPEKGYGVFMDTGIYDGEPNISMYTLPGMGMFRGELDGMGGQTGSASGKMASTVHGGRIEYMGYRGVKVANPYAAGILEEYVF
jgi:hypothetical protein